MLALAVKAAHVFFEDQPPYRWQWWELTISTTTDPLAFVIQGERWTFMFHDLKETARVC